MCDVRCEGLNSEFNGQVGGRLTGGWSRVDDDVAM